MMIRKDTIIYEAHGNLYLNITNRCTADCIFCLKRYSDGVYGYNLRLIKEPTVPEVIKELSERELSKYNEIVFTGFGEPLIRLDDVLTITKWLTVRGTRVRLDTSGHAKLLYPDRNVAEEMAESGMKVVSISLNAHDADTYNHLCDPKYIQAYKKMLEFAKDISKSGMELRFTVVNLPIVNIEKCKEIADKYRADFKVRGYSGSV
ncbi:MAG: TatD family nuclease-associated radical SAM protein [Candidatus Methanoperedens sp.]|nr:TatD family nuclease-associated radical SAM protein [Candidatus Methanoperedens sp.]